MLKLQGNEKILIVRLTALGDCIHTIPLACAIKKQFPDIFIGWAVSEKCQSIIKNNPITDKVHIIPKKNKKEYVKSINEIRNENYTVAIDSQELLKSALISFLSGAKYRLAHDKSREFSYLFANKKLKYVPIFNTGRHVIERNMDFARFIGIENYEINFSFPKTSETDSTYIDKLSENIDPDKKTVIISPSTTWKTKFWGIKNWAEVIKNINTKVNIILTGGNNDIEYIESILQLCNVDNVINLAGKTNVLQLKELYARADIVLSPDSGSAHLAAATQKPVVICLCGATSTVRNGVWGNNNINISANLNCQPCYKKICKYEYDNVKCMEQLEYQSVIEAIGSVLNNE